MIKSQREVAKQVFVRAEDLALVVENKKTPEDVASKSSRDLARL